MMIAMPVDGFARRIVVDGLQVGHASKSYDGWTARLWPVVGRRPTSGEGDVVRRPYLKSLRTELQRRIAEDGPWWVEAQEGSDG